MNFAYESVKSSLPPSYNPAAFGFRSGFRKLAHRCGASQSRSASEARFRTIEKYERFNMKVLRTFGIALLALTAWSGIAISQEPFAAGTWTKVVAAPPSTSGVGHIQMLTDGSVLALDSR